MLSIQPVVGLMFIKPFSLPQSSKLPKASGLPTKKRRFTNFNSDIHRFKQWLLDNSCSDVCMESTGKYWIPVFNLLEDQINVTIANPKLVKAVKGNKDDLVCRIPCISAPFFMASSCIFQSSSLLIPCLLKFIRCSISLFQFFSCTSPIR